MVDLLIKNIGQLATARGSQPKKGSEMAEVFIEGGMCVGIKDGLIDFIGREELSPSAEEVFDAGGNLVTPGLIDCHTHLVFGGWRQHELTLKLGGAGYLDILQAGGGILSTVKHTRTASFDELYEKAKSLSLSMAHHGTTVIEAKSGYGLNLEDEVKQLKVIERLNAGTCLDFVPTFMGAHAVPNEFSGNPNGYIDFICESVLPVVAENNLAEYCDVFCETGVFDVTLSAKLLQKAREFGFKLKIHADEIQPIGGGELAGELKCHSAEHLIAATDEGIQKMAHSGTIGVLLPATSFYLDKPYARVRFMLESGMAVAVASDFNPGSSPNYNLQLAMNLACLKYRLTPKEVLTAVTLNAAAAIGRASEVGSIELGKKADLVIWDAPDLDYIFYRYGNNQAAFVFKNGKLI